MADEYIPITLAMEEPIEIDLGEACAVPPTYGSMAFEIKAVNGSVLTLSGVSGIEVGYTYSMQIGNNYNAWGKISAISGNTVTVSDMPTDYVWDTDAVRFISFPEHPELGTFKIGEGAHTFGIDNKANMMGAFATGQENISDGKRSFTAGKGNFAGYHDAAFGQNNSVKGFNNLASGDGNKTHKNAHNTAVSGYMNNSDADNVAVSGEYNWGNGKNSLVSGSENNTYGKDSYAGGNKCQASKSRSFAHGKGLYAQKDDQAVFGTYNATSTDDLFQVGMGTADNARKNAFVIRNDGRAAVAAQPQTDNDVATKKYVDDTHRYKTLSNDVDLNSIKIPGFYTASGGNVILNRPSDAGAFGLTVAKNASGEYYTQTLYAADTGVSYKRWCIAGTWGEWEYENSPLRLGKEYRTTERWGNKPVYVQRINCGLLPSIGNTSYVYYPSTVAQVIRVEGQMLRVSDTRGGDSLPYYDSAYGDIRITATRFGVKTSVVSWNTSVSLDAIETQATVYYVKE